MKKLFLTLAAGLIACAVSAQEPRYAAQTLGTYLNAAQAATNVAYVVDCRKQNYVTFQVDNQMSTSATDVQTFAFSRSVDGLTYSTTLQTFTLTPVASTASTLITNINTYGCGYIKFNYTTNAAATAIATNTIKYGIKISAP